MLEPKHRENGNVPYSGKSDVEELTPDDKGTFYCQNWNLKPQNRRSGEFRLGKCSMTKLRFVPTAGSQG
jgi:hypothetical protein